ncbi:MULTISPECIES: energy-coupling factor transporter ATPase [Anaerostipes]|uniref:energy-coupling factor transporter ATPase n=1 Tax=Anaerostipes TaxID=207244 RepID=UPI000951C091|nr:energy-coupling factor transporter ATPase [Anaerostipes sp. 494a]OLR59953.1 energy-coupling factor transporter ATPase [Anaerostipes sp. 494a]
MSIDLEHVDYIYEDNSQNKNYALKDVNLEIHEGEFIGIVGHTGSGKSTLIQHLNGLVRPTNGKIFFNGQDIFDKDFDLRGLRGKVGICFQYPEHQLFEVTILDDVCFGPMNFGKSREEAEEIARKALFDVGIKEELFSKSPFQLSGGQKRRVAIAGILAMEPEYFILDEPTAGLDPIGRDQILNLLKNLHETKGISIILVSHSMEDVASYVDRMIVMNQGSVLFDGNKREVFSHQKDLEKIGLSVPFFTYLAKDLNDHGFPVKKDILTLQEAKDEILKVLRRKSEDA